MVLLFLLLGSDAQVCDKYDVHDIDWKVVCICAHYGLFKHQTRTWQKKSGQKIGSKVLNLFLKQGTCQNTYYINKNIYIRDKLRAPNNLQIRGQFIWVNNIIMGFGLSCSPSKSPQPKAHDYLPTKKCPRDKSPQNIIGTVSNVGFWPWAFGRGQMDLVGKWPWANGFGGQMSVGKYPWANIRGQMSVGKCLWANVRGQMSVLLVLVLDLIH